MRVVPARGQRFLWAAVCLMAWGSLRAGAAEIKASEPGALEIDSDPQLFVDDAVVDNTWGQNQIMSWGVRQTTAPVRRVFHQPRKYKHNPVFFADDCSYLNVIRDNETGVFRMWYQVHPKGIAYAESRDGIRWKLPRVGKYRVNGTLDNNMVLVGPAGGEAGGEFLLDLPKAMRRGYSYVMVYATTDLPNPGLHLIGSQNGVDWAPNSDVLIAPNFAPDAQTSIVWDPKLRKYVGFTRAVNLYRDTETGPRRRVARMEHTLLWDTWPVNTENVLQPDELDIQSDHGYFYGMPVKYYAGMYWGFLWPFRLLHDIQTELAFSRDGRSFQRLPNRPKLIELGPKGAWDHGMVMGSTWVEVGDEWWIYYMGTDKGHNDEGLKSGVGLTRVRKEGFVSLRSPIEGGVVVTRLLRWPGGKLYVNADASQGELTVKVRGYDRKPVLNFDPGPSVPMIGDGTRYEVRWSNGDIASLAGKAIRLEFLLKNIVDLYGFTATPDQLSK